MSKHPAISIVMPVYNPGAYLGPAVQSIFAQTFTDWELLAIDDGSTDGSWEYLQRIDDPRVRIARNERNLGVCVTINRAMDLAQGRWIARMDADDINVPTRLEKQIAALEADRRIDLLGTGTFLTDAALNCISVRRPVTNHAEIVRHPSLFFPLTFGALMGKAEWWKRWRMDPRAGISGHEFDLYFRSHLESRFSNVAEPLYIYRFVGHTRSWTKLTKSVYCKAMTLIRNGFRMGIPFTTLFGLATLAPRPILWAVKLAVGSKTGLVSAGMTAPGPEDVRLMKEALEQVGRVEVPLKRA
ncbi:MAG: glycosyltransferase family 2 protein [Phycisphaerae bacterium]